MLAFETGKCEEAVKYIKDHFVAVAFDAYIPANTEEEAKYANEMTQANNGFSFASAGGHRLNKGERPGIHFGLNYCLGSLKSAVAEFKTLPETERKPKLAKPTTPVKESRRIPSPPPGGLILTVYNTLLERDGRRRASWYAYGVDGKEHALEPQRDTLWLTESEAKSLVPSGGQKGASIAVPAAIQNRIFYNHAQLAWPDGGDEGEVRASELKLTVEEVAKGVVKLRLDGHVKRGDFEESKKHFAKPLTGDAGEGRDLRGKGGIDLRFLGFLEFDTKAQAFKRFDVVAVGDLWGWTSAVNCGNRKFDRFPIGIEMELNPGTRPADRIPPKHAVPYVGMNYFAASK